MAAAAALASALSLAVAVAERLIKGAPLEGNDHIPEKTLEEARWESPAWTLIQ